MRCSNIVRWMCSAGLWFGLLVAVQPAAAQTLTTGTLSGTATDQQGAVLPGVAIVAAHLPTGTTYESVTGGDGRFQIPNVRVGGPYTVTAALSGFKDQKQENVMVALGEDRAVDFKLTLATLTETVNVTAGVIINESRAGTAANVPMQAIEELPTIARELSDFARTSPYFNQTTQNDGPSFLSVAGRNNRYNNIQIDGSVNNDLFGLSDTGTPGGQTGTPPISIDAVQELQLVVAPYDVRQGGFSGGGINLVTRSGSNQYAGTGFWFGRNESLVGKIAQLNDPNNSATKTAVGGFSQKQGGFSLGGPISQNKAFFFGNLDLGRKNTPAGFSISGTSGQAFGHQAEAQRFLDILKNQYGYTPSGNGISNPLDQFSKRGNSDKIFVRTDFNLAPRHQLTVRNNYVKGLADIGPPTNVDYFFPDVFYLFVDKLNSTVGQLNSTVGTAFNELRIGYQRDRANRTGQPGQPRFPFVRVDLPDGTDFKAGTENFSTANSLDQDIVELTDDVTFLRGKHTITIGTHNELFHFRNLFIRDNFGNYRFTGPAAGTIGPSALDNFAAGLAQQFQYSYSNTSDPLQPAEFSVRQFGMYAGDQWRAVSNVTLTYGMRIDIPHFPDTPHANPAAVANFGFATDVVPSPKMYSPRAGFNWDLSNGTTRRQQVRGGIGLFTGRTPYVWLSNQYGNTGIDFTRLSTNLISSLRIPFNANPDAQPKSLPGVPVQTNEIDVVDPNYKFPALVRGNLAYDRDLGIWGLVGTAELLFTRNVKEIKYQNLNFAISGADAVGRPLFARRVASLGDVILLTNTTQGSQWSASFKVDRPFKNGFFFTGSYLYGRAKSIMDGTSSQAASNWGNVYIGGDVNNPPLTTSNFDVGHRISFSGTAPIPLGRGIRSTVSVYYNGQSGQPYVLVYNGDLNGDNRFSNDIVYVPSGPGDSNVIIRNGTIDQLLTYLRSDDSTKGVSGGIPARNAGRSPWVNSLDLRYAVDVPTGGRTKVELTMDVLNMLNLFSSTHGWRLYPNFNSPQPVRGSLDKPTGKEIIDLAPMNSSTFNTFSRDDLRSRWQAQWGIRVRF